MKRTTPVTLTASLLTAAALMLGAGAHAAQGHAYEHAHGAQAPVLKLNAGKKWAGDEPLRQSMTRIRDAVDSRLPAVHRGKLSTAQYDALGTEIDAQIANIVQNCKLEPEADEVLHAILAEMIDGNETLQGKNAQVKRSAGVVKVVHSLEQYGKHFEHPGWRAPNTAH